jgi:hypothetical protein
VRADRRDAAAYDRVTGDWDEVVELAYAPELVEPALDALAGGARHWTLVSSVSVYARNDEPGADESATLVDPTDFTRYPDAKAAAERATSARLGDRLLIVRPGLIVGPGDPTDRFGYWLARFSRGGPVLVPTAAGRFVQVVDVDDLATWIAPASLRGTVGIANAVGDPIPLSDFLRLAAASAGYEGALVELDDDALLAQGVGYWAGPRSLPLWLPLADAGFAQRSAAVFQGSGGSPTPLERTVRGVLADELARGVERERRAGLTASEERAVIRGARRAAQPLSP